MFLLQGFARAVAAFLTLSGAVDSASFSRLARLPVANPGECGTLLSVICSACIVHDGNRLAAGPTVVRRVCDLMQGGHVLDLDTTHEWCRAVRLLFSVENYGEACNPGRLCDGNLTAFGAAGGVEMLLAVMRRAVEVEPIGVLTAESVGLLVRTSSSMQAKVISGGGVQLLYALLRRHPTSEEVQCTCMSAFSDAGVVIADGPEPAPCWAGGALLRLPIQGGVKNAVLLSGALSRVYAALASHPSSISVHGIALEFLHSVSVGVPANALRIATTGGLALVYASMRAHRKSLLVQQAACKALRTLATHPDNKEFMGAGSGCLGPLYAAMDNHLSSAFVQEQGCGVLLNLAMSLGSMACVMSSGGLSRVLSAMAAHPSVLDVQEVACKVLGNLALVCENAVAIVSTGGLDRLYAAMAAHPSSRYLWEVVCGVLSTLAIPDENKVAMVSHGCLERLYAAIEANPSAEAVSRVVDTLLLLSATAPNMAALKAGPASVLTRAAMVNHAGDEFLQSSGRALLGRLRTGVAAAPLNLFPVVRMRK